jgi:hypothetical protein
MLAAAIWQGHLAADGAARANSCYLNHCRSFPHGRFSRVPAVFGFGRFIFGGIDPSYLNCETINFGAKRASFRLNRPGISALSQWLAILALLTTSSALGGVIALLVSETLRSWFGLRARVLGGG